MKLKNTRKKCLQILVSLLPTFAIAVSPVSNFASGHQPVVAKTTIPKSQVLIDKNSEEVSRYLKSYRNWYLSYYFPNGSADVEKLTNGMGVINRGKPIPFIRVPNGYVYQIQQKKNAKGRLVGPTQKIFITQPSKENFLSKSKWNSEKNSSEYSFPDSTRGRDYLSILLYLLISISPFVTESMQNTALPIWGLISNDPYDVKEKWRMSDFLSMFPDQIGPSSGIESNGRKIKSFAELSNYVKIGTKPLKDLFIENETNLMSFKGYNLFRGFIDLRKIILSEILIASFKGQINVAKSDVMALLWAVNGRFVRVMEYFDYLLHQDLVKLLMNTKNYSLSEIFSLQDLDNLDKYDETFFNLAENNQDTAWIWELYIASALIVMSVQHMSDAFNQLALGMSRSTAIGPSEDFDFLHLFYTEVPHSEYIRMDKALSKNARDFPAQYWDPPEDFITPPSISRLEEFSKSANWWASGTVKIMNDVKNLVKNIKNYSNYINNNYLDELFSVTGKQYQYLRARIENDTYYLGWRESKASNGTFFSAKKFLEVMSQKRMEFRGSPYTSASVLDRRLTDLIDVPERHHGWNDMLDHRNNYLLRGNDVSDIFLNLIRYKDISSGNIVPWYKVRNRNNAADQYYSTKPFFEFLTNLTSVVPEIGKYLNLALSAINFFMFPTREKKNVNYSNNLFSNYDYVNYTIYGEEEESYSYFGMCISTNVLNKIEDSDIPVVLPLFQPSTEDVKNDYYFTADNKYLPENPYGQMLKNSSGYAAPAFLEQLKQWLSNEVSAVAVPKA